MKLTDAELEHISKADQAATKYVDEWVEKQKFGFINHRTFEMRRDFREGYRTAESEIRVQVRAEVVALLLSEEAGKFWQEHEALYINGIGPRTVSEFLQDVWAKEKA